VPVGTLFRRGQSWQVFALEHGRARLRAVEVVRRSGGVAAIAAGLEPGMSVVVFPPGGLSDGAATRTR